MQNNALDTWKVEYYGKETLSVVFCDENFDIEKQKAFHPKHIEVSQQIRKREEWYNEKDYLNTVSVNHDLFL